MYEIPECLEETMKRIKIENDRQKIYTDGVSHGYAMAKRKIRKEVKEEKDRMKQRLMIVSFTMIVLCSLISFSIGIIIVNSNEVPSNVLYMDYIVQEGDTLEGIAERCETDNGFAVNYCKMLIKKENEHLTEKDFDNDGYVGKMIRIPLIVE